MEHIREGFRARRNYYRTTTTAYAAPYYAPYERSRLFWTPGNTAPLTFSYIFFTFSLNKYYMNNTHKQAKPYSKQSCKLECKSTSHLHMSDVLQSIVHQLGFFSVFKYYQKFLFFLVNVDEHFSEGSKNREKAGVYFP